MNPEERDILETVTMRRADWLTVRNQMLNIAGEWRKSGVDVLQEKCLDYAATFQRAAEGWTDPRDPKRIVVPPGIFWWILAIIIVAVGVSYTIGFFVGRSV